MSSYPSIFLTKLSYDMHSRNRKSAHREADRQTDRQRQTDTDRQRQTDRDRETDRSTDRD